MPESKSTLLQAMAFAKSTFDLLSYVEDQMAWVLSFAETHNVSREKLESLNHLFTKTRIILQDMQTFQESLNRERILLDRVQRDNAVDTRRVPPRDKLTPYPRGVGGGPSIP